MSDFFRIAKSDIESALINLQQITFEITGLCNLKCLYCCYGDIYDGFDKDRSSHMSFDKAKRLLDYLFHMWRDKNVLLTNEDLYISFYGGEPLLNIDLIYEIILYSKKHCPVSKKLHFSMTTNGVILDKYIDFIVEYDILLLISLDGDKEGNYFRRNMTEDVLFDRIYKNVKLIKNKYPIFFKNRVEFNSVLNSKNSVIEISSDALIFSGYL